MDEDAAMEVYKRKEKRTLQISPFIQKFEYGVNSEGFCTYHHMVLQLEDIVDVLKALFGSTYDFIFYFDHSSGHDKLRPNGLNANNMNKFYGGEQNKMRRSEIKNAMYLGPFLHTNKLQIGDQQSMQYLPDDTGPFYLDDAKKQELKFDCEMNKTEKKKYSRAQLIDMIKEN